MAVKVTPSICFLSDFNFKHSEDEAEPPVDAEERRPFPGGLVASENPAEKDEMQRSFPLCLSESCIFTQAHLHRPHTLSWDVFPLLHVCVRHMRLEMGVRSGSQLGCFLMQGVVTVVWIDPCWALLRSELELWQCELQIYWSGDWTCGWSVLLRSTCNSDSSNLCLLQVQVTKRADPHDLKTIFHKVRHRKENVCTQDICVLLCITVCYCVLQV